MPDLVRSQQHGETNMPECLLARTKDGNCMSEVSLVEHHTCSQRCPECCQLFCIYHTQWIAVAVEQGQTPLRRRALLTCYTGWRYEGATTDGRGGRTCGHGARRRQRKTAHI